MKKIVASMLACTMLAGGSLAAAVPAQAAAKGISVVVDELPIKTDAPPLLKNGRTLVPFRAVAEALNVQVSWDPKTATVTAADAETSVRLKVGNRVANRNGETFMLDTAPILSQGRVLLPLRSFSDAFKAKVQWDPKNQKVSILSAPKAMSILGYYALGSVQKGMSSWQDLFGVPNPQTAKGNTDLVSDVAFGWYTLDKQGALQSKDLISGYQLPVGWEEAIERMKEYNIASEMMVYATDNHGGVPDTLAPVIVNETLSKQAAQAIAQQAMSGSFEGVHIDFEELGLREKGPQLEQLKGAFTRFVRMLDEELAGSGIKLTLSLHPLNSSYKAYDYKALGELADQIVIMAYEYNPQGVKKPEPNDKVMDAVKKAKALVAKEKLLLGINTDNETQQTLLEKVGISKREGLQGIAIWRLGINSASTWNTLRSTIKTK